MKYLLFILKVFLKQRRLNDTFRGGVGTFLLSMMIIAFLRDYKEQHLKKQSIESMNQITLADYLMKFLAFYGNFDYKKKSIYMVGDVKIRSLDENSQFFNLYSPIDDRNLG